MKVSLNIENDEELRLYIKDCIKGQVLSIVREDFLEIVKTEVERKVKVGGTNFDYLMREALRINIHDILINQYNISKWSDIFLKPFIDDFLEKVVKDKNWEKLIEEGAKRKLAKLIDSQK
jgi:hypothetical protein